MTPSCLRRCFERLESLKLKEKLRAAMHQDSEIKITTNEAKTTSGNSITRVKIKVLNNVTTRKKLFLINRVDTLFNILLLLFTRVLDFPLVVLVNLNCYLNLNLLILIYRCSWFSLKLQRLQMLGKFHERNCVLFIAKLKM